ncbi:MAG: hypothetical protein DRI77_13835 [Chloroflexi bacterium]|nr:MAG: hypothetical protein DRI77_13835 [Chloroflexota bacterium]
MTKKSRKKKGRPVRFSPTQMVQPGGNKGIVAPRAATQVQAAPKATDLSEEYHYVIADLKRIGIIAVAMLTLLVALALLLP